MFQFLKRKKNRERTPENQHSLLIHRIEQIHTEQLGRVFSPDKSLLRIRVQHRCIAHFTQFLRQITFALQNVNGVNLSLFNQTPIFIYLRDWFTSPEGYYLDAEKEFEVLKIAAIKFVETYIEVEEKGNDKQKFTLISATPIMNQIKEITDQLILVTKYDTGKSAVRDPSQL